MNEYYFLIAQMIGLVAFAISTLKFQVKCGKKMLWIETPNTLIWAVHMLMLGGHQAAVVNTISSIRAYLSIKARPDLSKHFLIISIILASIIIVPTIESVFQILPLIAFSLYGMTLVVQENSKHVRLFCFASDATWLIYASILGSLPLMFACTLSIISAIIGFYRHEKDAITAFIKSMSPRTYP